MPKKARPPPDERPLTLQQQRFVDAFMVDGNATRAAKAAGYATKRATIAGSELLRKPHIAAEVKRRRSKEVDDSSALRKRIIEELKIIAFFDMRSVSRWGRDPELTDEQRTALKGAHFDRVPARQSECDAAQVAFLKDQNLWHPSRAVELIDSTLIGDEARAVQTVSEHAHGGISLKAHDKIAALLKLEEMTRPADGSDPLGSTPNPTGPKPWSVSIKGLEDKQEADIAGAMAEHRDPVKPAK